MKCSRQSCRCQVDPERGYDAHGKTYCCEECFRDCTDDRCVCTPCGCSK